MHAALIKRNTDESLLTTHYILARSALSEHWARNIKLPAACPLSVSASGQHERERDVASKLN
jgi:hypothetical protein